MVCQARLFWFNVSCQTWQPLPRVSLICSYIIGMSWCIKFCFIFMGASVDGLVRLVPKSHPYAKKKKMVRLVNQVNFLGLAHSFVTSVIKQHSNILHNTHSKMFAWIWVGRKNFLLYENDLTISWSSPHFGNKPRKIIFVHQTVSQTNAWHVFASYVRIWMYLIKFWIDTLHWSNHWVTYCAVHYRVSTPQ